MDGFIAGFIVAAFLAALIPNAAVEPKEMAWALRSCEANGGLKYMEPGGWWIYRNEALCANGAKFTMQDATQ